MVLTLAMHPRKLQRLTRLFHSGISACLIFGMSFFWLSSAHAQFPSFSNPDTSSNRQPNIHYIQRGNMHIANVRIDGVSLFQVAAPAAIDDTDSQSNILPIEWRVNEIETHLEKIVNSGIDPNALRVTASTLNNQEVIIAQGKDWKLPLMTITELDRQIDSTSYSISEIAKVRASKIKSALLEANRERQPEHLKQQFFYLLIILVVVIIVSLILRYLQSLLKHQWKQLNSKKIKDPTTTQNNDHPEEWTSTESYQQTTAGHARRKHWPKLSLPQRKNINLTLRSLLWWSQVVIWLSFAILALLLFPQTRQAGLWLVGVPVSFVGILLVLSISKKVIDILVVYGLHRWSENDAFSHTPNQRIALRTPTITYVLQEVTRYIVIIIGILMFLDAIQAPLALVLTGIGIVGLSAQNLIKDFINGFLILWEDQYTKNDVVKINGIVGLVEYLNLRVTQLRTLEGELVTIANGSFTTAINLTHQWSRINLGIEVAYSTDLDQAMTVIEEVAIQLQNDPDWGVLINETPTILGVDAFGESSITIRLLIKTQPMRHWDVGREYRRRLKQAFDQANITIPFPQRSVWFEGYS